MRIVNLLFVVGAASCGSESGISSDNTGATKDAILNGTTISAANRAKYLPVRFLMTNGGRCSGTLLTNDLVLTAEHCRWQPASPPTIDIMMNATARLFNGDGTVTDRTVTELWPHYSNVPTSGTGNSMGADILIVRVSSPFSVDGTTTGFRRMLWPGSFSQLLQPVGIPLMFVGAGADPWVPFGNPDSSYEANIFDINGGNTVALNFWNVASRASSQNDIVPVAPFGSIWSNEPGDSGAGLFRDHRGQTYLTALNYNGNALTFTSTDIASYLERMFFSVVAVGCPLGENLYFGDINGDGRDDMICHNPTTGSRKTKLKLTGLGFEANWTTQSSSAWCNHSGSKVFVGDFSGDGRTDLLCSDTYGRKWIDLGPTFNGSSSGGFWNANWCHNPDIMHVGDFDGDGKADLACQEPSTGELWIDLGLNGLAGTDSHVSTGWCSHPGSRFLVGKSNADARSDAYCIDTVGDVYIENASVSGSFAGASSAQYHSPMLAGSGVIVFLADLDGDGRDDILARQSGSNTLDIDYGHDGYVGSEWTRTNGQSISQTNFCSPLLSGTSLIAPRSFDGNPRNRAAELLCRQFDSFGNDNLQILAR